MNARITRDISDRMRPSIMLAAWPGMGSVGVGALDYLRRKLDAMPFAEIDMSEYFAPEAVVVEKGLARSFSDLPSHVFYYVEEPPLIISESEAQIPGMGGTVLMGHMLDLAQRFKVEAIYTGAAYAMPISHNERVQVLGAANQEALRDALEKYGVEILQEGHIAGLNGLLLGSAGLRNIRAACLLATMPMYAQMMPNPKASREIVRVWAKMLELDVNMSEIDQAVERMDDTMSQIEEKIRTAFSTMEHENEDEIELEKVDEEQVPQVVMERIERLFGEVEHDTSREKAALLKRELDRWNLYGFYEDRFLGLFRKDSGPNRG